MILGVCDTAAVLTVTKLLKTIFNYIRIIIPSILILSGIIGFKNVLLYDKDLKETVKSFISKIIISGIIIFIPTLVLAVTKLVSTKENNYIDCFNNATDEGINKVLSKEIDDGIDTLKSDLDSNRYYKIKLKVNSLKDDDLKTKYDKKMDELKTYVDLNKELNILTKGCKNSDFKKYTSTIEEINDSKVKETLSSKLEKSCAKKALDETGTITNENKLTYHVFVPENATTNMPLVMYLHGDGSSKQALSNKFWANARSIYGADVPFIVVAPEGGMWAETDGRLEVLKDIINETCEKYSCDTDRIIITGHSRGAIGTWALANKYPSMFYAAVPVSCNGNINPDNYKNIKVRAYCGNQGDDINYYSTGMKSNVNRIKNAGGDATFIELNSGHGGTPSLAYNKDLYEWLLN